MQTQLFIYYPKSKPPVTLPISMATSPSQLLEPKTLKPHWFLSLFPTTPLIHEKILSAPSSKDVRTSLAVQWLRLWASPARGVGSIPRWGTKISQAIQNDQNIFSICPKSNHFSPLSKPSYLVSPFPPLTLKSCVPKIARDFFSKTESDYLIPCLISSKVKHRVFILPKCFTWYGMLNISPSTSFLATLPLFTQFHVASLLFPALRRISPQGLCSHLNIFSQIFTFRYLLNITSSWGLSPSLWVTEHMCEGTHACRH